MNNIQTDLSDQSLIIAIRANLCEFYRHLNRSFPETFFENVKFARWCASIAHPWFNGVLSSQLPGKEDEAFIEETIGYFRGKGIGAAVTLRPLNNAHEMGYRIGVLQSSDMGYNIYRRLGFRHLCQIEYFSLALR